jgi:hypothetical protein
MSEPTNLQRAVWAERALIAFRETTNCDWEDCLGDLLCDLMHWADASKFDFDAALDRARMHYEAEVAE